MMTVAEFLLHGFSVPPYRGMVFKGALRYASLCGSVCIYVGLFDGHLTGPVTSIGGSKYSESGDRFDQLGQSKGWAMIPAVKPSQSKEIQFIDNL